jgi:hypothetical protein
MQILANAGCEWVLLAMEHSGVGIETIKLQHDRFRRRYEHHAELLERRPSPTASERT